MLDPDVKGFTQPGAVPENKEPAWEPKGRHMATGILPAGMGKKPKAPKIDLRSAADKAQDEEEGKEPDHRTPNRRERRFQAAAAPRNIRKLIRENKWTHQFKHNSSPKDPKRWLDPETHQTYLETKDQECTTAVNGKFVFETHGKMIKRQLKNMLRRKAQGRVK